MIHRIYISMLFAFLPLLTVLLPKDYSSLMMTLYCLQMTLALTICCGCTQDVVVSIAGCVTRPHANSHKVLDLLWQSTSVL